MVHNYLRSCENLTSDLLLAKLESINNQYISLEVKEINSFFDVQISTLRDNQVAQTHHQEFGPPNYCHCLVYKVSTRIGPSNC